MTNQNINTVTEIGGRPASLSANKTKICSKCKIEKPVSEFCKQKTAKDGLRPDCKICKSYVQKQYKNKIINEGRCPNCRKPNPTKHYLCDNCRHGASLWETQNNKYLISVGCCPECGNPNDTKFYRCDKCRIRSNNRVRKYSQTEKGKIKGREKQKTPQAIMRRKRYYNAKSENDINFLLRKILRTRLHHALKERLKTGSCIRDLGCSVAELIKYIEDQWSIGMSWDNYGYGKDKWNIDHIIPLSSVDLTDRKQFLVVNNYKNLRPLWQTENFQRYHREKRLGTTPTIENMSIAI